MATGRDSGQSPAPMDRLTRHERLRRAAPAAPAASIARALMKRPRLYPFDDCFSAVDAATDALTDMPAAYRADCRARARTHQVAAYVKSAASRPSQATMRMLMPYRMRCGWAG